MFDFMKSAIVVGCVVFTAHTVLSQSDERRIENLVSEYETLASSDTVTSQQVLDLQQKFVYEINLNRERAGQKAKDRVELLSQYSF